MKKTRRRIDVNLEELDRLLDGAREAPLSEADHDKLKDTLHALAALLVRTRNTEKTSEVVEKPEGSEPGQEPDDNTPPPPGHGRNGAEAFGGYAQRQTNHDFVDSPRFVVKVAALHNGSDATGYFHIFDAAGYLGPWLRRASFSVM
jgi:hypothetical protein